MTDIAGAAPAAAEPSAAAPADTGNQPSGDAGQQQPAIDRSKEAPGASIDRAFAEVDRQEKEAATKAPKEPGETKPNDAQPGERADGRDEKGRFKAKDATAETGVQPEAEPGKEEKPVTPEQKPVGNLDAPTRFSADAKAAWDKVPDPVKGEVNRAFRELEQGLGTYQKFFEPMKPFYEMAQKAGVTVHESLENYVRLDQALVAKDPQHRLAAIEEILSVAGVSPRDYAAFIMGQPADQAQSQNDATVRELRGEIADLKRQLGGVSKSIEQRVNDDALAQVEAFADQNPRLKQPEFQQLVARLLHSQMATDLKSAYDMAERLSPAPPVQNAQVPAASNAAKPTPPAQTRNGNLSVTGAPGSGSNPQNRKTPQSARESVERAFSSLGLG